MDILKDKAALITGAARGIGREIALVFAQYGSDVACVDLDLDGAEETSGRIREMGRKSSSFKCDISNLDRKSVV